MTGHSQFLDSGGRDAGGGTGGGGEMGGRVEWNEGWLLSYPGSQSTLSQMEMVLLVIRVGPVVGLLFSFSLGWLRNAFLLLMTWLWMPIAYTGRPLALIGTVCQSVWSGEIGKCTSILLYIYFLLTFLWWLAPHSTSANVGLLSIGALPCFSNSFYKRLKSFGAKTLGTSKSTYLFIRSAFTPERRLSRKSKQFTDTGKLSGPVCDNVFITDRSICNDLFVNENQTASQSIPEAATIDGANDLTKSGSSAIITEVENTFCIVLNEARHFVVWVLCTVLHVSDWTPRLEANGNEASKMYYGMEERHIQILRKNNTKVALLTMLPWKSFSRLWGYVHNLYLPPFLRYTGLPLYAWLFSINLDEATESSYGKYRNLASLFRRTLRPGLRPIDPKSILTSPADGRVLHLGPIENGLLEQVKGVTYSMRGFFGPPRGLYTGSQVLEAVENMSELRDEDYLASLSSRCNNIMWQCIIYLAPGDYHHIHSPADWNVHARRHIPGELFSVKPELARWLQGLFSFNERAIYTGQWEHGFFSMTAVGATNVGSIDIDFDEDLQTNVTTKYERHSHFDKCFLAPDESILWEGVEVKKGDHFGEFNLGSTIVLLFEAPKEFKFNIKPGQTLRYGQAVGNISD